MWRDLCRERRGNFYGFLWFLSLLSSTRRRCDLIVPRVSDIRLRQAEIFGALIKPRTNAALRHNFYCHDDKKKADESAYDYWAKPDFVDFVDVRVKKMRIKAKENNNLWLTTKSSRISAISTVFKDQRTTNASEFNFLQQSA